MLYVINTCSLLPLLCMFSGDYFTGTELVLASDRFNNILMDTSFVLFSARCLNKLHGDGLAIQDISSCCKNWQHVYAAHRANVVGAAVSIGIMILFSELPGHYVTLTNTPVTVNILVTIKQFTKAVMTCSVSEHARWCLYRVSWQIWIIDGNVLIVLWLIVPMQTMLAIMVANIFCNWK